MRALPLVMLSALVAVPMTWCFAPHVLEAAMRSLESVPLEEQKDEEARPSGYGGLSRFARLATKWAEAHPGRVVLHQLAKSRKGAPLLCIELRSRAIDAAEEAERPSGSAILFVGGLDGRSVSGAEAVVRAFDELVAKIEHLPPNTRVFGIPFAAPDALANVRTGRSLSGLNAAPIDNDDDGRIGEDGPDDVDGDGLVLEMMIEAADGEWARTSDPRFFVRATPSDSVRYHRVPEGHDDDADGEFNEDGAGGVDYERHFPIGWAGVSTGSAAGRRPLSEPVARAIADLVVRESIDAAVLFQGNHGGLRADGQLANADSSAVRSMLERTTGRQMGRAPEPREPNGGALEWLTEAHGVLAIEVAPWGPMVAGVDGRPLVAPAETLESQGLRGDASERSPSADDRAWGHWLDEVRGGAGFSGWHPVDLGAGTVGLVGGFEPWTRDNPPAELLDSALHGLSAFAFEFAHGFPRLDIEVVDVSRHGPFVEVAARVSNRGQLATSAIRGGGEVVLELVPTCTDSKLCAGETRMRFSALSAGQSTGIARWIIRLPRGASLSLEARAGGALAPVVREVRP